jgi:hypothetical protein
MRALPVLLMALALPQAPAISGAARITLRNPIAVARPSETIVIDSAELLRAVPAKDVRDIRVRDDRGSDLLTQAIDLDDDGTFDQLIFQVDLGPSQVRTLTAAAGERRIPRKEDFRAYGRFVRERRDDFAWENDLVAHRMYGAALETWAQEPLTSSAVDVWVKRTPRLIINDWYMVDDYHRDTGEGADFYSAGTSRGCGGSGIVREGKLYASANFRQSRALANGPLRVLFELRYEPWDAGGVRVSETKRIMLDAGHYLNRFESTYAGLPDGASVGIGIKSNPHALVATDAKSGVLRAWEPIKNNAAENGWMGCAVIRPGETPPLESREVDGNHLVLAAPVDGTVAYLAGAAWDRGGRIHDVGEWDAYVAAEAARLRAPVQVQIGR